MFYQYSCNRSLAERKHNIIQILLRVYNRAEIILPKVVVEWLKLLLHNREVPGSNLGPETGYPDRGFSWFSSVNTCECWDSGLKLGHDRFLPNTFQFILQLSPSHSTLYTEHYIYIISSCQPDMSMNVIMTNLPNVCNVLDLLIPSFPKYGGQM
jgi:hypothetical protein